MDYRKKKIVRETGGHANDHLFKNTADGAGKLPAEEPKPAVPVETCSTCGDKGCSNHSSRPLMRYIRLSLIKKMGCWKPKEPKGGEGLVSEPPNKFYQKTTDLKWALSSKHGGKFALVQRYGAMSWGDKDVWVEVPQG